MRTVSSRRGHAVKLSGNEFVILATLTKSPGRYVSKDDLLVAVAGLDHDLHHSVIDTYIKYLNRSLQEAHSAATIEKSLHAGFRLCP